MAKKQKLEPAEEAKEEEELTTRCQFQAFEVFPAAIRISGVRILGFLF